MIFSDPRLAGPIDKNSMRKVTVRVLWLEEGTNRPYTDSFLSTNLLGHLETFNGILLHGSLLTLLDSPYGSRRTHGSDCVSLLRHAGTKTNNNYS